MKYYAGIGSRRTPGRVLTLMTRVAIELAKNGWTLRSGGAFGADTAFERGAGKAKEIFYAKDAEDTKAHQLASELHPAWERLNPYVRNLMARSCYQILGKDLATPVDLVICWTPDGQVTGGTGQALRLAAKRNIKVHNFGDIKVYEAYIKRLQEL